MSWFGNTLFPIVQDAFEGVRDLPTDPKVAAEAMIKAGFPHEAAYIETCSKDDLQRVYAYSGLFQSSADLDAWAMAEDDWNGR